MEPVSTPSSAWNDPGGAPRALLLSARAQKAFARAARRSKSTQKTTCRAATGLTSDTGRHGTQVKNSLRINITM
jgi:hypothetical protein